MGWREDVDAVTNGTLHGPLLNGISGGVFPCACGERFESGWVIYRHGHKQAQQSLVDGLRLWTDPTIPPDTVRIIQRS
jgi:hypothetical protein